jgi:U3 small nucleolar RNA-associated protein 21
MSMFSLEQSREVDGWISLTPTAMEDQHQHTKRQRQDGNGTNGISEDQQHQQVPPPPRRLFAPFRALGVVSNGTPHALQLRSSTHLKQPAVTVVTSLGSSWAMWDAAASLNLLFVGASNPMRCDGCTSDKFTEWRKAG